MTLTQVEPRDRNVCLDDLQHERGLAVNLHGPVQDRESAARMPASRAFVDLEPPPRVMPRLPDVLLAV